MKKIKSKNTLKKYEKQIKIPYNKVVLKQEILKEHLGLTIKICGSLRYGIITKIFILDTFLMK